MKIIISENIIKEAVYGPEGEQRYYERITVFPNKKTLKKKISKLLDTEFPPMQNIGVLLHKYPKKVKIKDKAGNMFYGDSVWAIIKNNRIVTFLIRDIKRVTKNKLKVDKIMDLANA